MSRSLKSARDGALMLLPRDFANNWDTLSPWLIQRITTRKMSYRELESVELEGAILDVLRTINGDIQRSGRHRSDEWEEGWNQNLESLSSLAIREAITPHYFNKFPLVRWNQRWIKRDSPDLEYAMFETLMDWVGETYLANYSSTYEFGCGTGHNLIRLREKFPKRPLIGLDWASSSQIILQQLSLKLGDQGLSGINFDYFHPDIQVSLDPDSVVLTVASLEQIGNQYGPFLDYLLLQRPARVVHIEPVTEMLDASNLMDYLSIKYFEKRNYLSGYLSKLRELEAEGKIDIVAANRTFVGSFFIDGYSLIVWEPV